MVECVECKKLIKPSEENEAWEHTKPKGTNKVTSKKIGYVCDECGYYYG